MPAQSGGSHAGAACGALEHDEQCGGAGIGPFQAQIVIDQLRGLRRQWEEAQLVTLAAHAELTFGKQHVLRIKSQYFGRAKPLHEH
jgi:hypothetical protein